MLIYLTKKAGDWEIMEEATLEVPVRLKDVVCSFCESPNNYFFVSPDGTDYILTTVCRDCHIMSKESIKVKLMFTEKFCSCDLCTKLNGKA